MNNFKNSILMSLLIVVMVLFSVFSCTDNKTNDATKPKNATVLFDGTDFSHWTDQSGNEVMWKIIGDAMQVVPLDGSVFGGKWPEGLKKRGIQTKEKYQDFKLHVEFNVPDAEQDNSGIYIQRRYEIQIVDSYGGREHSNNCGAIYKQKQPDTVASKKPGEWQTYDITFRGTRFEEIDGHMKKVENARVSVVHNGVLIHDDVEILNKTGVGDEEGPEPAPILLQDHGSLVKFRNVWILPLKG